MLMCATRKTGQTLVGGPRSRCYLSNENCSAGRFPGVTPGTPPFLPGFRTPPFPRGHPAPRVGTSIELSAVQHPPRHGYAAHAAADSFVAHQADAHSVC